MKGFDVDVFENGEELLENADAKNYDVCLFDINTPKKSGIETLKELRRDGVKTPVLFLTAMSDIENIKDAFESGCSDYIKKPFMLEEVEVRINSILFNNKSAITLAKDIDFKFDSRSLIMDNKELELSEKERDILFILAKNIGSVVTSEVIKNYVWCDKFICDNTLRTQMKKLREKIEGFSIENVRGVGYKIESYDK